MNTTGSAIVGYLLKKNKKTANVPNLTTKTDILSILKKANSEFNLQLIEFVYIKSDQPSLYKQKERLVKYNTYRLIT